MNTRPDIAIYRKTFPANNCVSKYYPELDFLDISDDIKKLSKRNHKPLDAITTPYHSIGYFLNDKLIRIDNVGSGIPKETYIIWENDLIKEAHEFYLGIRWGQKISKKAQLSSSWYYTYENNLTKKVVWVDYEDRKYYDHGEMKITYDYEYDNKGLLLIRQTVMGTGALWKEPEVKISYDREREAFLKNCTITKSALIGAIAKVPDNIINFNPDNNTRACSCKKCGKPLSYIATINLGDKRFNLKNIKITGFPILHCFNCLETQEYNAIGLGIPVKNKIPFTEALYKFKKVQDEEVLENAFLKVGGQPIWIQQDEHPNCASCGETMKFIIEINTDEALTNGIDTLTFGDSGKLYVFVCCNNVMTIPQWY